MNFDDLIPFIVILVIIGFNILKSIAKKKKKSVDGKSPAKPAPKKAFGLSKLVDTIKAELERAALEAKKKQEEAQAPAWEQEEADAGFEDQYFDDDVKEAKEVKTDCNFENQTSHRNIPRVPPDLDYKFEDKESPRPYRKRRRQKQHRKLSVSKLREAIILSEILAKPVGLRE